MNFFVIFIIVFVVNVLSRVVSEKVKEILQAKKISKKLSDSQFDIEKFNINSDFWGKIDDKDLSTDNDN